MSEPQEIVTVWPDFAEDFACKADRCQHSCCRGWEIDIDEATAAYYASLDGPLGEALRANIDVQADGTHAFHLTADEHCPFLRADGLCRLIREIGEEALCEVCTMHPRFFIMSGGVELAGFGLACEKAVELLLSADSLRLRAEGESQSFEFGALLAFLDKAVPREWLLPRYAKFLAAQGAEAAEKLVSYILYRQLDKAERYGMEALCRYARFNVVFIYLLAAKTEDLPEAVRRWSEQIEYDEENTARLIRACGRALSSIL